MAGDNQAGDDQQPGEGRKAMGQAGTSCEVVLIHVTMAMVLSAAEGVRGCSSPVKS